jgi:predicted DNA-binding protein (MmcQ/YjbR family)
VKREVSTREFDRPVVRRLRKVCLSLPETSESASWGHPNFRAGKRTFVTFEMIKGRPSIALRLDPAKIGVLIRRRHFFATPYGRGLWLSLWADDAVDWNHVTELIDRSYRTVANKRMLKLLDSRRNSVKAIAT